MSIVSLKELSVDENCICSMDYIRRFEELKHKYRVCCEFEHIEDTNFKVIKYTPVIYCYGHRVCIYPLKDNICRAHIMASVNFEKKFKEEGINFVKYEEELLDGSIRETGQFGESGEFILDFYIEDIDKVSNIFKFKKANTSSKNPYSIRNLHEYLRFMRNIDSWYGDILNRRLIANREHENTE